MTAEVRASTSPGNPGAYVESETWPPRVRAYTLRVDSISLDKELELAVDAVDRAPFFSLRVDWNNSGLFNHRYSDLTRMVQEFTFTQELASDLPATVGFVEGTAAAKLVVTLAGRFIPDAGIEPDGTYVTDRDTIRVFSPYGPVGPGPMLNRRVELRTGFRTPSGNASLLRFSGRVSGYSPTASTREVALEALDPVSTLRRQITQYAFGIDGELLYRVGGVKYPFSVNTQWFIDRILRENGYYASSPPGGASNGLVTLSATMHGSYQHEIGSVTYITSVYYPSATASPRGFVLDLYYGEDRWHPFSMMYPNPVYNVLRIKWLALTPIPMRPNQDGWGMSGWVRLPEAGSTITTDIWSVQPVDRGAPQLILQLRLSNGIPHAFIQYPNGQAALYTLNGVTLREDVPTWTFCAVHFLPDDNGVTITMKFGDRYGSVYVPIAVPTNLVYENVSQVFGRLAVPFTNFSVWFRDTQPASNDFRGQSWSPTAQVDPGLNWVGGVPDILNRESYDLLKEIVAAEFGAFYFDETGKPFFRSRALTRAPNRAPEIITSDKELSDLVLSVDDSVLRNSIDYEYAVWGAGPWEIVWEPEDPYELQLAAGTFNTWTVPLPENTPIIAETDDEVTRFISSELWGEVKDNPYYTGKLVFSASLLSDPTVDVYSAVTAGKLSTASFVFRVRRIDARTAQIRITNNCAYGVRFATASKIGTNSATGRRDNAMVTEGEPAFRLPGRRMVEYPSTSGNVSHERSIATYGLQTYNLGGKSQWRQTAGSGAFIAASVMSWTAKPKPVLSQVEVPHNPRRRLYDEIILTEPDSFGARISCTLHGISTTYSADGARDLLTLRPNSAPPGW